MDREEVLLLRQIRDLLASYLPRILGQQEESNRQLNMILRALTVRHPTSVRIVFEGDQAMAGNPLTLQVGQKSTATVVVFDQFGQPMNSFDFTANPPSWTIDQPSAVGLASGSQPNQEVVSGTAATAAGSPANLTVSVPGVANPTDTEQVTVTQAASVPTSVQIQFSAPA